jgi:hypothetical protein
MCFAACRSGFKRKVNHEQVAAIIDPRSSGQKVCSAARPAMKLTGKEDDVLMNILSNWWNTELAEHKCCHIVFDPAGDQHAVSAVRVLQPEELKKEF